MASSGSGSKGWLIVGGIALVGVVIYCIWKLNELCDNVQNIVDHQDRRHIPNTNEPIDVMPETAKETITETMVQNTVSTSIVSTETPKTVVESHKSLDFHHSEDFRIVTVKGTTYSLTTYQSLALEKLWNATKNHIPEVHQASILEGIGSCSKRLRDVFKSNMRAYRDLIAPGERKGTFRLNVQKG
jgi:hypothetical protein